MTPARVFLLALALALTAPTAAVPLLAVHHAPLASGPGPVRRITLSGALLDSATVGDPGSLALAMYGDVVLGQAPDHAGWTWCEGRCQLPGPLRSRALYARADSRLTIVGDWAPSGGTTLHLAPGALVLVRGVLTAPAGGLTVDVSGGAVPRVLLTADAITGPIVVGALPPGTRLTIHLTQLILEAAL